MRSSVADRSGTGLDGRTLLLVPFFPRRLVADTLHRLAHPQWEHPPIDDPPQDGRRINIHLTRLRDKFIPL